MYGTTRDSGNGAILQEQQTGAETTATTGCNNNSNSVKGSGAEMTTAEETISLADSLPTPAGEMVRENALLVPPPLSVAFLAFLESWKGGLGELGGREGRG